jgi:3-hydroxyisobutyrate dehydrogenase
MALTVGFIGLGNVGAKLAGSLLRNKTDVVVRDLDDTAVRSLVATGARAAASPAQMMANVDMVITCLPSPAISAAVLEDDDGILGAMRPGQVWMEMSTTDEAEVKRLGQRVVEVGGSRLTALSRAVAIVRIRVTFPYSPAVSARRSSASFHY